MEAPATIVDSIETLVEATAQQLGNDHTVDMLTAKARTVIAEVEELAAGSDFDVKDFAAAAQKALMPVQKKLQAAFRELKKTNPKDVEAVTKTVHVELNKLGKVALAQLERAIEVVRSELAAAKKPAAKKSVAKKSEKKAPKKASRGKRVIAKAKKVVKPAANKSKKIVDLSTAEGDLSVALERSFEDNQKAMKAAKATKLAAAKKSADETKAAAAKVASDADKLVNEVLEQGNAERKSAKAAEEKAAKEAAKLMNEVLEEGSADKKAAAADAAKAAKAAKNAEDLVNELLDADKKAPAPVVVEPTPVVV